MSEIKKVTLKEYKSVVGKCLLMYQKYQLTKYDIARESLKVIPFETAHSHNFKGKVFTLVKFSKDTKIPMSTLRKWREEWVKVVSKLPANIKKDRDISAIRKIMKGMSADAPAKEVIKKYKEHTKAKSRESILIQHHIDRLRACMNAFCTEYRIDKFEKEEIEKIQEYSKKINQTASKALKPKVLVRKGSIPASPTKHA